MNIGVEPPNSQSSFDGLTPSAERARAKVEAARAEAQLQLVADRARERDLTPREAIEIASPWMMVLATDRYRNESGERWIMPVLFHRDRMTIVPRELVVRVGEDIASKSLGHGALRSVQLAAHLYGMAGGDLPFPGPKTVAKMLGVKERDAQQATRYAGYRRRGMMTAEGWQRCWDLAIPVSVRDLARDFVLLPRAVLTTALMPMDVWVMAWLSMRADHLLAHRIIWADERETIDKRSNLTLRRATLRESELQFPGESARRRYWLESIDRLSDYRLIGQTGRGLKIR